MIPHGKINTTLLLLLILIINILAEETDKQEELTDLLEDIKQKNTEIVDDKLVYNEEVSKGQTDEELIAEHLPPHETNNQEVPPTSDDDEVPTLQSEEGVKSPPSHQVKNSVENKFDEDGNPVYYPDSDYDPNLNDPNFDDMLDEDDEDDDEIDIDDIVSDIVDNVDNVANELSLKGMPPSEDSPPPDDDYVHVDMQDLHSGYLDSEVPPPKVEKVPEPGEEELLQAEEILGIHHVPDSDSFETSKPNYRKGYALLQSASSKGNRAAKVLLGFGHLTGDHEPYVSHNTSLAFEMFEEGARAGLPSAQRALAILYSAGVAVDSSQSKALLYYTFSALGGDALAQMALAFRYWSGISVAQSCESALKYYRLVADDVARKVSTRGLGQVVLRIRLVEEEQSPQSSPLLDEDLVQYYQFLADKGDLQAQLGLGQLYLQGGRGIERNLRLAQHYFSAAAKAGNTNAYGFLGKISVQLKEYDVALKYFKHGSKDPIGQWGLATLYYHGWGVEQDYDLALSYYTSAAQQGHTEAELQLGLMHLNGIGVKKDYGIALKHFNLASKSGHVLAFYNLGMMHAMGIGVMRNCQTSAELLKNVAERGTWGNELMDAHALYHKGFVDSALIKYLILAEQGYEVAQANAAYILDKENTDFVVALKSRYKRAFVNWKRAAAQGFGGARLKLGDYYYYGQGTEANPGEAAEQYQIASDVDHNPQAMFNLGYMHELGIGRQQDMHLAKRYYDMAASTNPDAHLPTLLANTKLQVKIHMEWLIRVYQDLTLLQVYEGLVAVLSAWVSYFSDVITSTADYLIELDNTATEDWDIYLMSILGIALGVVMAMRTHNMRVAQRLAAAAQQPPLQ